MFHCNHPIILPLALAVALTLLTSPTLAMGTHPKVSDDEAVASRIQPVGRVELAAAAADSSSGPRTGEALYKSTCSACHASGAAGAPKVGDNAAWAPRLAQGLDGLLKSAINGKNAMPPKGGSNATEFELARAIVYMTGKSGGSFKEPVEKK